MGSLQHHTAAGARHFRRQTSSPPASGHASATMGCARSITSRGGPYAMVVKDTELPHLRRCVALATEALEAGDEPFGSVLVGADGEVLAEDHNRVASGDRTRHPEFELARWSAAHMSPEERAAATVYTSGEHCPMCAAAHAWVGLGRIVYATSSEQLTGWLSEWNASPPPVAPL